MTAVATPQDSIVERPLTVREAAERLNVSEWSIYNLCATGQLAHIRPAGRGRGKRLRILPSDLRAFQDRHRIPANT